MRCTVMLLMTVMHFNAIGDRGHISWSAYKLYVFNDFWIWNKFPGEMTLDSFRHSLLHTYSLGLLFVVNEAHSSTFELSQGESVVSSQCSLSVIFQDHEMAVTGWLKELEQHAFWSAICILDWQECCIQRLNSTNRNQQRAIDVKRWSTAVCWRNKRDAMFKHSYSLNSIRNYRIFHNSGNKSINFYQICDVRLPWQALVLGSA